MVSRGFIRTEKEPGTRLDEGLVKGLYIINFQFFIFRYMERAKKEMILFCRLAPSALSLLTFPGLPAIYLVKLPPALTVIEVHSGVHP